MRTLLNAALPALLLMPFAAALAAEPSPGEAAPEKLRLKSSFAVQTGFDSNPDDAVVPQGTGFHEGDLGMRLTYEDDKIWLEAKLDATHRQLWDNEDPQRWSFGGRLSGRTGDKKTGRTEFELKRFTDATESTIQNEDTAVVAYEQATADVGLRLEVFAERSFEEGGDELDNRRAGFNSELSLWPDAKLSPFLRTSYARIDFPNRKVGTVNRNGDDAHVVAGLSWKPSDKFRLAVGGRYNVRKLKDNTTPRYANGFVNVEMRWTPVDKLTLTGTVERELDESSQDLAVVKDKISYKLGLDWKASQRLNLGGSVAYKTEEEIGDGKTKNEVKLSAKASYDLNDDYLVFVETGLFWSRAVEPGEDPTSKQGIVLATGFKSTF